MLQKQSLAATSTKIAMPYGRMESISRFILIKIIAGMATVMAIAAPLAAIGLPVCLAIKRALPG